MTKVIASIVMNKFNRDDLLGRDRFKSDFGNNYQFEDTSEYAHTDIMMTACTNNSCYSTEIKNRSYLLKEISGSTWLENIKLEAFREGYRDDEDRCLIYFNYYPDGWIGFDMTNRIRYNEGLGNEFDMELPTTTSYNNGIKNKTIISICYTNNMLVQDKICIYE